MLRAGHTDPIHFGHDVNPDAALHTCETLLVVYSGARVELARVAAGAARRTGVVGSMVEAGRTMSASTDPMQSPEWEAARHDWYEQSRTQLDTLQQAVNGATPGSLALETIYAPMHDMAGLAGVFGYDMLGRISRSLIETLRKGANPLDARMLMIAKAHLAALAALHARDVRGDGGPQGLTILTKLASIHA
jgi:hypothetical protein